MLILVRHGQSAWNAADRFAGWADIALTEAGREEARATGAWIRARGIVPDVAHTSLLARARSSADLILDTCRVPEVPVLRTARLNERHYGRLQGMPRAEAAERFGPEQVARWRRGIDDRPPVDARGKAESLSDVRSRLRPYVDDELLPTLDAGHTLLVVSHGNTLRMLVQVLEGLSDADASALELPTGGARLYETGSDLRRVC